MTRLFTFFKVTLKISLFYKLILVNSKRLIVLKELWGQVNNAYWVQTIPRLVIAPPTEAFVGFMLTLTYLVSRFLPRFCSDFADPGPIKFSVPPALLI